jgi:hypothetical protein
LLALAQVKNWRSVVRFFGRSAGRVVRNVSLSRTLVVAQSVLPCAVRKMAIFRMMDRARSMVLSARERVLALRARSRALSMDWQNPAAAGRARPRAHHARAGAWLQDAHLPAAEAGRLRGGDGDLAPAQAAVLAADVADLGTASGAVPLPLHLPVLVVTAAASAGPGPWLLPAGRALGAAGPPGGPPG